MGKGSYSEWLWFSSLGYGDAYITILRTKVLVFFSAAIIFFLLFSGNLLLAARLVPKTETNFWPWAAARQLQSALKLIMIMGTVVLSLIFGSVAQGNWEFILRYFNGQPFGVADPVFHKDIGFYVFSLPFLNMLKGWFLSALIITLMGSTGS